MKQRRVEFSPEAVRQARQVEQWWRANRPVSPGLLMEELTRYHFYYTVDENEGVIRIHALWHTARGQGPTL